MKPVPPGRRFAFTRRDPNLREIENLPAPPDDERDWQLWDWQVHGEPCQYDHDTEARSTLELQPFLWLLWVELPPRNEVRPRPPPTKPAGDPVDVGTRPRPVDGPKRSW